MTAWPTAVGWIWPYDFLTRQTREWMVALRLVQGLTHEVHRMSQEAFEYHVARCAENILLIEPLRPPDRGWLLLSYHRDGSFKGDTWHASIADAKHQAEFRNPGLSGRTWLTLSGTREDALTAAREMLGG